LSVLNGLAWFLAAPQEKALYLLWNLHSDSVGRDVRRDGERTSAAAHGVDARRPVLPGLALANARTLFVALPILLVAGLCAGGIARRKSLRHPKVLTTLVAATVLIGALTILFLRTDTGRDFAERSSQELASGVLHSEEDANWQFRLSAWKEAWRRFEEYPLAGEGYGIPFVFEMLPIDNDPRPHNTFLTVLYKMGLIGFLPLLLLLVHFFWSAAGAAYRISKTPALRAVDCYFGYGCILFLRHGQFAAGKPVFSLHYFGYCWVLGTGWREWSTWNEHC